MYICIILNSSSDKNYSQRTSNRSENSHRLEEGDEGGGGDHDQGKESLLGMYVCVCICLYINKQIDR
jgi:hypothetical protein